MNKLFYFFLFLPVILHLQGYSQICGKIELDTNKWAPVAYLSLIPEFSEINTISYDYIIERSQISEKGEFCFSSKYISDQDQLYRIHFSQKGDPACSLIIGGRNHNHLFLFANKKDHVQIQIESSERFINYVQIEGGNLNKEMTYVHSLTSILDTLDYFKSNVKRELIAESIITELKNFADTSSYGLVSLYALYQFDFLKDKQTAPGFYKKQSKKWRSEDSLYFKSFRSIVPVPSSYLWWLFPLLFFITGFVIFYFFRRNRGQRTEIIPLQELTIQERKVFCFLQEGKTNKEIAESLSISISTVKSHVNSIYSKLNISSRKQAMDMGKVVF